MVVRERFWGYEDVKYDLVFCKGCVDDDVGRVYCSGVVVVDGFVDVVYD